jgi:hypothetical protein
MFMSFSLPRVVAGITLVLPTLACSAATPDVIWCHNCTSEQVENAVLTDPVGIGTLIYVGDTVSRSVNSYEVYASVDDSQHPPKHVREVENAPADPDLVTKMLGAIDFYNFGPVGWEKHFDLHYTGSDPTASGFTTANSGDAQVNFNSWMNSSYSGSRGLTVLYGYALSVLSTAHVTDASAAPHATITTTLDDESKITSTYNSGTHLLEADPNTAFDAENYPIPYLDAGGHAHKLGGVRHYPDDYQGSKDYNSWLHQISHFPVTVQTPSGTTIGGGGSSSGGDAKPVICVETTDEGGKKVETCFAG